MRPDVLFRPELVFLEDVVFRDDAALRDEDFRLRPVLVRLVDLVDVVLRPAVLRPAVLRPAVLRRPPVDFLAPELLLVFLAVRFRLLFVSPASRRCLFTVAAAICLARAVLRPISCSDSLMCSYCRARFRLFTPVGGIPTSC